MMENTNGIFLTAAIFIFMFKTVFMDVSIDLPSLFPFDFVAFLRGGSVQMK